MMGIYYLTLGGVNQSLHPAWYWVPDRAGIRAGGPGHRAGPAIARRLLPGEQVGLIRTNLHLS